MKISIIGLWRDSENHISNTINSIEKLNSIPNIELDFYFYENDSKDNTKTLLEQFMKDKKGKLTTENLGFPKYGSVPDIERLIFLSFYRNKLQDMIQNADSDYTLMIDTDISFNNNDFLELLKNIQTINNSVMIIANTRQPQISDLMLNETPDSFYDVFCLRDKFNNTGLYFTDCPLPLKEDRDSWNNQLPVRILSGFSGFSLIETKVLKQCRWSTSQQSEHINFCLNVNRHGDIYIAPKSIPIATVDLSNISLDRCKQVAIEQINHINKINQIYALSIAKNLKTLNN
jgi:hypothetical protein